MKNAAAILALEPAALATLVQARAFRAPADARLALNVADLRRAEAAGRADEADRLTHRICAELWAGR